MMASPFIKFLEIKVVKMAETLDDTQGIQEHFVKDIVHSSVAEGEAEQVTISYKLIDGTIVLTQETIVYSIKDSPDPVPVEKILVERKFTEDKGKLASGTSGI